MKLLNKKFSFILLIFLGILILLISLFFYIRFKAAQLQESNEEILSLLRKGEVQQAMDLVDTNMISKQNKGMVFLQKFSFLSLVKEKILLQQDLILLKESLEKIRTKIFLTEIIQQTDNPLIILENLRESLGRIEKYDCPWVVEKRYEIQNWLSFLGEEKEKNYLILFQDSDVPRPTGGFIGAYAFLSFDKGRLSLSGDNIFSLEEIFLDKIIPPYPFLDTEDRWFFHDANWFFDFPLTSQKIISLYTKTGKKPGLDGVIFLNINTINSIVQILGTLELGNDTLVNGDNFIAFYKKQIQESAKPAPLRVEKNLWPIFLEKLQEQLKKSSPELLTKISNEVKRNFEEKEFQVYSTDDNLQYFFDNLDWTGKIKESKNDYLGVNISFLKNNFLEDKREKIIELKTELDSEGKITNHLIISAPHFTQNEKLIENYLKIYLPKGIILKEVKGGFLKNINIDKLNKIFNKLEYQRDEDLSLLEKNKVEDKQNGIEIYEEGGKTVIGCWSQLSVEPLSLSYLLPDSEKEFLDWELVVQKQSGQKMKFSLELITPSEILMTPSLFPLKELILLEKDLVLNFKKAN